MTGPYKTILPLVSHKLREAALDAFKATATEATNRIIDRTPVDTGRAKGNTLLQINSLDFPTDVQRFDPDGGTAKSNAASNALSVANAASNAASIVSTAASNALSVANAASNATSIVSNAVSVVSNAVSIVSTAASNALSVANAASNAASIVSTAASNALSVANAASNAASVVSNRLSGFGTSSQYRVKGATIQTVSGSTLVNITSLSISVSAGGLYLIQGNIMQETSTSGGFAFGFSAPALAAGGSYMWMWMTSAGPGQQDAGGSVHGYAALSAVVAGNTAVVSVSVATIQVLRPIAFQGMINASATGVVQIMARASVAGGEMLVRSGYIRALRLE